MLKSWKYLFVILLLIAYLSSGCGGGGGGSGNQNNNQERQEPQEQNEYNISILSGTWTGSNGRGTATGYNGMFDLIMTNCTASFSDIQSSGSSATAYVTASAEWDAYQDNRYFSTVIHFDSDKEFITLDHTDINTWRYTFPVTGAVLTIKLTSETTAEVYEEGTAIVKDSYGSYTYEYSASYTMTKQYNNNNKDSSEYDISIISGRWTGVSGTGTATGSDGIFDVKMESFSALFTNLTAENSLAKVYATTFTTWAAYQTNEYVTAVERYNDDAIQMTFEHVDTNTWRYNFPNSQSKITVKFTSETTAEVYEESRTLYTGSLLVYDCDLSYTITKQPDTTTPSPDEYDISIISGTWKADSGSGTATDQDGTFFSMTMKDASATFTNLQFPSASAATGYIRASTTWDVYRNGEYVTTNQRLMSDTDEAQLVIFEHIDTNTWRYITHSLQGKIKLTSETTTEITEENTAIHNGLYSTYLCNLSYNVTKQTDDTTPSPDTDPGQEENGEGSEYEATKIFGTWIKDVDSNNGTATSSEGDFTLSIIFVTAAFGNFQDTIDGAANMDATFYVSFSVYRQGGEDTDHHVGSLSIVSEETIKAEHVDTNTWRYTFPNSDNIITVHFTSGENAEVYEEGSFDLYDNTYQYSLSYTLTKR